MRGPSDPGLTMLKNWAAPKAQRSVIERQIYSHIFICSVPGIAAGAGPFFGQQTRAAPRSDKSAIFFRARSATSYRQGMPRSAGRLARAEHRQHIAAGDVRLLQSVRGNLPDVRDLVPHLCDLPDRVVQLLLRVVAVAEPLLSVAPYIVRE